MSKIYLIFFNEEIKNGGLDYFVTAEIEQKKGETPLLRKK